MLSVILNDHVTATFSVDSAGVYERRMQRRMNEMHGSVVVTTVPSNLTRPSPAPPTTNHTLVCVCQKRARLRPRSGDSILPEREVKRRLLQRRELVHLLHPFPGVSRGYELGPSALKGCRWELRLVVGGVRGCPLAVPHERVRSERPRLDDGDL